MFWIGFVVGIITLIVVSVAYIAWCFHVVKVDRYEYRGMVDTISEALVNRESTITTTHNDEILSSVTLVEK